MGGKNSGKRIIVSEIDLRRDYVDCGMLIGDMADKYNTSYSWMNWKIKEMGIHRSFSEETIRAWEKRNPRNLRPTNYCVGCGIDIGLGHDRCWSCYNKSRIGTHPKSEMQRGISYPWQYKMGHQLNVGDKNGMYGRTGDKNPAWTGGLKGKCTDCGKPMFQYGDGRCLDCWKKFNHGANSWSWRGGISYLPYPFEFNSKKAAIRQRDGYTCQLCGLSERNYHSNLSVHHIDYNKDNLDNTNLISLCKSCNTKVNSNRGYWTIYFLVKLLARVLKRGCAHVGAGQWVTF